MSEKPPVPMSLAKNVVGVTPKRRTAIQVAATCPEETYAATARTLIRPEVGAAFVIDKYDPTLHDINDLAAELGAQVAAVNDGDLRRAEGLLVAQAHTLNQMFVKLAALATTQKYLPQWDAHLRMAFKAQSQCRMTLETLATLKNPPMVFAKQANINNGGQQQVNNGTTAGPAQQTARAPMRAQETQTRPNELSEGMHGSAHVDAGATSAGIGGNPAMEAVGAIDRATNG